MKNKLFLSAVVIVFCILPILSSAETSTSAVNMEKMIEKINQFVDNIIIGRYGAALNRLESLVSRIESRMTRIEAKNIDVSEAEKLLATAKTKIQIAKVSSADIASTTNNTSFGTTTSALKENFKAIKAQITKAKEDIRAAHAALVDVVKSLKPGDNKLKDSNN